MNLESREFEKNNDPPTVGLSVDEKALKWERATTK
jgi:hypothetical protein